MKKIIPVLACVLAAALLASCASTKIERSSDVSIKTPKRLITDYQGAELGRELPLWVDAAAGGETEALKAALGKEDYKIWILQNRGDELKGLIFMSDNFDVQTQVANSIAQNVSDAAARAQDASDGKMQGDVASLVQYIEANMTLRGLEKLASSWTMSHTIDQDWNATGPDEYVYYVVFGMRQDMYDKYLADAISKIPGDTLEAENLRALGTATIAQLKDFEVESNITLDISLQ
ncbi:MAG: hypothetical protein MJ183_07220 [Treponemataceae bacterium]|nr:hypothetical protein [Treponemataceae bacterium]